MQQLIDVLKFVERATTSANHTCSSSHCNQQVLMTGEMTQKRIEELVTPNSCPNPYPLSRQPKKGNLGLGSRGDRGARYVFIILRTLKKLFSYVFRLSM